VVYHAHGILEMELPTYYRRRWIRKWARRAGAFIERRIVRRADQCIAINPGDAEILQRIRKDRTEVMHVPPGISIESETTEDPRRVREKYGLGDGVLCIYSGNLDQYQGLDLIVEGFGAAVAGSSDDPPLELVIVTGSSTTDLGRILHKRGLSGRVKLLEGLPFREIRELIRCSDIALVPRLADYGFPIKLLNYMILGKAVVLYRHRYLGIDHMTNSYVVPSADGREFARGILALAADRGLRERIGAEARRTALDLYNWDNAIRRIESAYARVLGEDFAPGSAPSDAVPPAPSGDESRDARCAAQ